LSGIEPINVKNVKNGAIDDPRIPRRMNGAISQIEPGRASGGQESAGA
jgi:hypothetical protein